MYNNVGNEMNSSNIGKQDYFEYYTIKKGDSIYGIARRYNINPSLLLSLNGLDKDDYIYPDMTIMIPKSDYSYYITKSGDTLGNVANMFKVTPEKLILENSTIYLMEGQILAKKN